MFALNADGSLRLYIIDFEHASFLPVSFLAYIILKFRNWWCVPSITDRIGDTLPRDNLENLGRAFYMFRACGRGIGLHKTSPDCNGLRPVQASVTLGQP